MGENLFHPITRRLVMTAAIVGVRGQCAHCDITFELKPWQLNAIAINEPFECPYCHKVLQLRCPRQLKQFRSLDTLALLRPSMIVLISAVLLVALVAEWIGLISVIEQLNISLVAVLMYFIVLRYARHRQRMTLTLQAVKTLPVEQLAGIAAARLGQR
jgi:type IV secretory pathway VirB3-like protein